MRALASFFGSHAASAAQFRDIFGRVSQIALILTLESPVEIEDYWGASVGGQPWRLSAEEARRVMRMRVEWDTAVRSAEIDQLALL